jgi:hypothetical protein
VSNLPFEDLKFFVVELLRTVDEVSLGRVLGDESTLANHVAVLLQAMEFAPSIGISQKLLTGETLEGVADPIHNVRLASEVKTS